MTKKTLPGAPSRQWEERLGGWDVRIWIFDGVEEAPVLSKQEKLETTHIFINR